MSSNYIHEANAEYRRIRKRVPLGVLHSEEEYKNAVAVLDEIIDEIGQNENHPLAEMAEALALFIHSYEEAHFSLPESFGPEILKNLMEEHRLKQSDLPEIGSQGVVSEILSGKRELNVRQIAKLAERFGVSPAAFIPAPPDKKRKLTPGKK
ncbi:helix-turn-helix domain-containing protein [Candidatus Manganitrophus noduliformans]|uniref:Helix-turn-helix domain-containing protein n=1 Tax=Candidatus Manganitrophus noduliformans TaxID=2606439 RepID=A0A7X6DSU7_9BACT|nr:helix-turn-helix domain-containing protein [Candidatus Manganitrophus noduliformans]NKE72408.1 helix-turn-helix domain-containing protein [Candidatus Manganitrophus noduliformans]